MNSFNAITTGCMVYWDVDMVTRSILMDEFAGVFHAGESLEQWVPEAHSPMQALAKAMRAFGVSLKAAHRNLEVKVEALADKDVNGFQLMEVQKGALSNQHPHIVSVAVDAASEAISVTHGDCLNGSCRFGIDYGQVEGQVSRQYMVYRRLIRGSDVGQLLVKLLKHLHGTCVRDVGGMYYLPEDAVQTWHDVVRAFDNVGARNGGKVEICAAKVVLDNTVIRSIEKGIIKEMEQGCMLMQEDIRSGKLGGRALRNRIEDAKVMLAKANEYEDILNKPLAAVRALIAAAEASANQALAMVEADTTYSGIF